MKEDEAVSMVSSMNVANDADVLKIRLDTQPLLQQLDLFLRGKAPKTTLIQGEYVTQLVDMGKPIVNKKGRQIVLLWATNLINPTTIQGNKPTVEEFNQFIADLYEEFADDVFLNAEEWDIEDNHLNLVVGNVMAMVEMALSRTIENQERKLFGLIKESLSRNKSTSNGFRIGGLS